MKTTATKAHFAGMAGALAAAIVSVLSQTEVWASFDADAQMAFTGLINAAVATLMVWLAPANKPVENRGRADL